MSPLTLPSDDMRLDDWLAWLRQTAERDRPAARRAALLRLVWQESYLIREGLIARVEALLGRGCFGSSPRATFYRDMAAVRRALAEAGHRLVYSRRPGWKGYHVEGRPLLDERLQRLIAGSVAEVDPKQIAVSRRLTPAQRFQQAASMIRAAEQAAVHRLRQRQPHLSEEEALRIIRQRVWRSTSTPGPRAWG